MVRVQYYFSIESEKIQLKKGFDQPPKSTEVVFKFIALSVYSTGNDMDAKGNYVTAAMTRIY